MAREGIVVFAHGSSVEPANESVRRVAAEFARAGGWDLVEPAFLEKAEPDLGGAIQKLVDRGASSVTVIPYFLTLGIHLRRDLPAIVAAISVRHSGLPIRVTPPLDGHPAMITALLDRARETAS